LAALHASINLDEFQFMANGWDIHRGLAPYRDFWDNHGLLANYLFAVPFRWWPETHGVITVYRLGAWAAALLTVALTAMAARRAFPAMPFAGRLAAALLLSSSLYLSKANEARGDILLTLAWATGLWLCTAGLRAKTDWRQAAAGFACGAALWFTPKGLFIVVGGGIVLLSDALARRRLRLRPFLLFAAGAFAAALVLAGLLMWPGVWQEYVRLTMIDSVRRKGSLSISPFKGMVKQYPFWMGLSLASIAVALWRLLRRKRSRPAEIWLWPALAFLLVNYFVVLPSRHPQSLMPVHPLVAILGAGVLHDGVRAAARFRCMRSRNLLWEVILGGMAISLTWQMWSTKEVLGHLQARLKAADRLATLVPPGEFVLSGEGPPVCRPAPLPAHVLVNYMLQLYAVGRAPFDIPASLQEHAVRFIALDPRLCDLPRRDLEFFRANYLPAAGTRHGRKRVLLAAGRIVALNEQRSTVSIAIARNYWVTTLPDADMPLSIDGHETTCAVYLSAGEHVLERADRPTTVVLSSIWPRRLDWKAIRTGCDSVPRAE